MSNELIRQLAEEIAVIRARVAELERIERPGLVGARYTTDAAQIIANNTITVVNFEEVDYDPLGLVTVGAGWLFDCPVAGCYQISAFILFEGTNVWTAGDVVELALHRNGVRTSLLARHDNWPTSVTNQYAFCGGHDVVLCAAGDDLQIIAYQTSGIALPLIASSSYNHVAITRVG